jgi:hypothetical protein
VSASATARDPELETLRAVAHLEEGLVALRHAVDTLSTANAMATRMDGRKDWDTNQYEAAMHIRRGYDRLGDAMDYFTSAHWRLTKDKESR